MGKLKVKKIQKLDILVISQENKAEHFILTPESIIIGIPTLSFLLHFLVQNKYLDYKILEGILEEVKE